MNLIYSRGFRMNKVRALHCLEWISFCVFTFFYPVKLFFYYIHCFLSYGHWSDVLALFLFFPIISHIITCYTQIPFRGTQRRHKLLKKTTATHSQPAFCSLYSHQKEQEGMWRFLLLSSSFSITGNTNNRGKQLLMQRIIVTPWRFIIIRLMMLFVIWN